MSQLSDELLLAYLDGQLDTPQARSVERMIGGDAALRTRIDQLKTTQGYLAQTFETLARRTRASAGAAARPAKAAHGKPGRQSSAHREGGDDIRLQTDANTPEPQRPPRSRVKMMVWAGVLSLLTAVVGYGAGKWMRVNSHPPVEKIDARVPVPANRWADDVAQLHTHFTTASVATDPESQSNRDLVQMHLSRILNTSIPVPRFDDHDLTFRRGQVLNYRGTRMMQLSYVGANDGLVALYVMPGGPDASPAVTASGEVATLHWSADGVRYVMAGYGAENSIRALAAVAMSQINAR
jgi:anti-sigma factor RsiW